MTYKRINTPFAAGGETTALPEDTQSDGTLSWEQGWGTDYDEEIGVSATAKTIDRLTMNELFSVLSQFVKYAQEHFAPEWIKGFAYGEGDVVLYEGQLYVAQAQGVSAEPTQSDEWAPFLYRVATDAEVTAAQGDYPVTPAQCAKMIADLAPAGDDGTAPIPASRLPEATYNSMGAVRLCNSWPPPPSTGAEPLVYAVAYLRDMMKAQSYYWSSNSIPPEKLRYEGDQGTLIFKTLDGGVMSGYPLDTVGGMLFTACGGILRDVLQSFTDFATLKTFQRVYDGKTSKWGDWVLIYQPLEDTEKGTGGAGVVGSILSRALPREDVTGPLPPPEGYLHANGSNVSRAAYSALFDLIGTSYGEGDGSTTFTLPNIPATGTVQAFIKY